uniref:Sugar phosphate transporter domain-containing protein n=1 Tax=Eutreptiella gymnastica TaxID=73025 RepID=A0A7S4FJH3_9EUGL|mmetsp:Transcript_18554/g.32273  ORF Transcript_18554/g.32273 Transcript_18554/m.32273 type:complete len:337 (+) Transcript_18554:66-1076(+)
MSSQAKPNSSTGTNEIILATVYFSVASIGMMTGNKVATNHLPLPSTLIILQAVATCAPLAVSSQVIGLQKALCVKWLPVAALFAAMLFTSMQSFLYCTVSTILVFRNVATICSTVVEYFVRGKKANVQIVASELTIIAGCVVYGWGQLGISWLGFFWIMLNVAAQVAYGNLVKVYLSTLRDDRGQELSKYTCAYYNNFLCLPFFLLTFFIWGEHNTILANAERVSTWGWAMVVFTCVCGYCLATSGFGLQKLVSATTFLVVNNMVKIANILLGMVFLNDRFSSFSAAAGCIVSLGAGVWYSYEQNKLNAAPQKHVEEEVETAGATEMKPPAECDEA